MTKATVGKWRARFVRELDGSVDESRPGAPRQISDAHVERVITMTLESTPRDALEAPTPFIWRKTADQILASVARYRERISDSGH